jgi:hypothetical protein
MKLLFVNVMQESHVIGWSLQLPRRRSNRQRRSRRRLTLSAVLALLQQLLLLGMPLVVAAVQLLLVQAACRFQWWIRGRVTCCALTGNTCVTCSGNVTLLRYNMLHPFQTPGASR